MTVKSKEATSAVISVTTDAQLRGTWKIIPLYPTQTK